MILFPNANTHRLIRIIRQLIMEISAISAAYDLLCRHRSGRKAHFRDTRPQNGLKSQTAQWEPALVLLERVISSHERVGILKAVGRTA